MAAAVAVAVAAVVGVAAADVAGALVGVGAVVGLGVAVPDPHATAIIITATPIASFLIELSIIT